jgi:hypothetical protein
MGLIPQTPPTGYTQGNCVNYTPVSEVFTVNIEPWCSRSDNEHKQLMFLNRYGQYDYFTFIFNRYEGINIQRQTFNSWNIDWGSNDPNKTQYSRGLTDSEVTMTETVLVNSGFIEQELFFWIQELYTSNLVYEIQYDGSLRPVNIVNTEYAIKNVGNRSIYNVEITYVYSNNISLLGM